MAFLEPIIAAAIGAGITALAVFLKNNKAAQAFLRYGSLIKKAYDIVDPILDKNIQNWNGSQVDQTFELAVEAVSDSDLSKEEIHKIAVHMAEAWLPAAAADKVRLLEVKGTSVEQDKVTKDITKTVNNS